MKPIIVAPPDLADGFRLAGVAVFEITAHHEIDQIVERIRAMPEVGLVLVDERFMEGFERALGGGELPMLASFPAAEVAREETYIDELTKRFLGQKIYIEGA
ncbi:MAG: V-type ATP synthase subunit F [Candidatus Bipolaricaulota bacterium]|nr:V-type ATP synthase subunit F [Candidatus Bipolaricaulota bacterium]MDW8030454.1 V-type ATP synthase subunit F [Candidatus Bipolaricaulota bacterium]